MAWVRRLAGGAGWNPVSCFRFSGDAPPRHRGQRSGSGSSWGAATRWLHIPSDTWLGAGLRLAAGLPFRL